MKHLVVALVCAVALGACIHDDIYKPQNPFNLKEVEWATKRGSNSVTGKIDAQGSDGKTYPCTRAGLVPDSAYNRELMIRTTGSTEDGVFFQKDAGFVIMYQDSERSLTERPRTAVGRVISSWRRFPMACGFSARMAVH